MTAVADAKPTQVAAVKSLPWFLAERTIWITVQVLNPSFRARRGTVSAPAAPVVDHAFAGDTEPFPEWLQRDRDQPAGHAGRGD